MSPCQYTLGGANGRDVKATDTPPCHLTNAETRAIFFSRRQRNQMIKSLRYHCEEKLAHLYIMPRGNCCRKFNVLKVVFWSSSGLSAKHTMQGLSGFDKTGSDITHRHRPHTWSSPIQVFPIVHLD